jgi:pimeloyl-ACP methyl ester carboxylesterase
MPRTPRWILALILAASLAPAVRAAEPARDVAGHWQGSLQGMLRIVFHFERTSDGELQGTMDSPDQGAMDMPLDSVAFAGDSLYCELQMVRGRYEAHLNAAGDSLLGHWRQGGVAVELALMRTAAPAAPKRPQEPHPPYPYDTLAVAFDNTRADGVRLAGTLTLPRGKGPHPCALLITGSGPEDRDEAVFGHRPFKVLADHLTRQGIAVLRVDDRGVGGSTGSSRGATSEDFAGDVLAGVEFLHTRAEVDKRRIGLIGHSEGGLLGPMVAAASKDVAFVVLLAGPGIPGDSLLLLQSLAARRAIGVSEDYLAREAVVLRRLYAAMRAADSAGVVREARALVEAQLSALPESQRGGVGNLDALARGAARTLWDPWMRWFATHDPAPALRRLQMPVLALNGSKDIQVTPRENLAGIEKALKAGGNRDFKVQELPGLNHLFQTCTACTVGEYGQLEETFAPSALTIVSDWIRSKTGLAK